MESDDFRQRINDISTQWTAVIQAHQASASSAETARAELVQRYGGAVLRYLLGAVRDADVAEELSHELFVRILRGDFHRASADRGRFRDYLKTALINLVNDYFRSQQKRPRALESALPAPASPRGEKDTNASNFEDCWREELLERTWAALHKARPNYYAVLHLRVEFPEMPAREMAERLTVQLDKPMTPDSVRKTLERARLKFADLLVDEVAASISSTDSQALRAELRTLDLLRYCDAALARRK